MKKTVLFFTGALIFFSACKKDWKGKDASSSEMFNEEEVILLSSSNYDKIEVTPVEKEEGEEFYTKGEIHYKINSIVEAEFKYGEGEKDAWAKKKVEGKEYDVDLTHKCKEKKSDYDKKIIHPLVKTKDCDEIVEGVIKYYKEGEWVATVDYGNGECDDLATKTTKEGVKTWKISEYKKNYKKDGKK